MFISLRPNWPFWFLPHENTSELLESANEWCEPHVTFTIPRWVRDLTHEGWNLYGFRDWATWNTTMYGLQHTYQVNRTFQVGLPRYFPKSKPPYAVSMVHYHCDQQIVVKLNLTISKDHHRDLHWKEKLFDKHRMIAGSNSRLMHEFGVVVSIVPHVNKKLSITIFQQAYK